MASKLRAAVPALLCALCVATTALAQAPAAPPPSAAGPPAPAAPLPAPPPERAAATSAPPAPAADSDNEPSKNSIYAELLGPGLLDSINYERILANQAAVRVGFGYWSVSASAGGATVSASELTFPITASYIGIRAGESCLELGGGMTLAYATGSVSGLGLNTTGSALIPYGDLMVGYRLQPLGGGGFQFRVGASALIGKGLGTSSSTNPNGVGVLPWGYISFGGSFGR